MAVELEVQATSALDFDVGADGAVELEASQGVPIYPSTYQGATEVTPSAMTQTLNTNGLMLAADITIKPIPNNYGLITWNGSTLTVS